MRDHLHLNKLFAFHFLARVAALDPAHCDDIMGVPLSPKYATSYDAIARALDDVRGDTTHEALDNFLGAVDMFIDDMTVEVSFAALTRRAVHAIIVHTQDGQREHFEVVYAPFERSVPFSEVLLP